MRRDEKAGLTGTGKVVIAVIVLGMVAMGTYFLLERRESDAADVRRDEASGRTSTAALVSTAAAVAASSWGLQTVPEDFPSTWRLLADRTVRSVAPEVSADSERRAGVALAGVAKLFFAVEDGQVVRVDVLVTRSAQDASKAYDRLVRLTGGRKLLLMVHTAVLEYSGPPDRGDELVIKLKMRGHQPVGQQSR